MSLSDNNWNKINKELDKLNKKFLHKHSVILNTSPPRVGKTINTILQHVDDEVPTIIFVDNEGQAKDLHDKLIKINKKENVEFYYWKSKPKLCYAISNINNKELIKDKKTENSFKVIKLKSDHGISHCRNCEYSKKCKWTWQMKNMEQYDVVLMNKHNIGTILIDDDSLFYKNSTKRSIIYDEEIDKLLETKYKKLKREGIELFNKIAKLIISFNDFKYDSDFIDNMDLVKEIFKVRPSDKEILNNCFDSNEYCKVDKKIYLEELINKIRNNIKIYDYLDSKNAPFPKKGEKYDFEQMQSEELFIDILIEKRSDHKIILLDATPFKNIANRIKNKVDDFKEIEINNNHINNQSLVFRIHRKKGHVNNSRMAMIQRVKDKLLGQNDITMNKNDTTEDKIYKLLEEDISFLTLFYFNEAINKYNELKNKKTKLGVVTYKILRFTKSIAIDIVKMLETNNIKNILYHGNFRGRSNLNQCEVMSVIGTGKVNSSAIYPMYRYLGGEKSLQELNNSYDLKKHVYNSKLFNEIVAHQENSGMEQAIFRNMPHIERRLLIIEGKFPEHLHKYFKHIFSLKIYNDSNTLHISSKKIIKRIVNNFLDSIYQNKKFKRDEKKENREKVFKKVRKYLFKPYKEKYGCVLEGAYYHLMDFHSDLMKKANIKSFSRFRTLYYGEYFKK